MIFSALNEAKVARTPLAPLRGHLSLKLSDGAVERRIIDFEAYQRQPVGIDPSLGITAPRSASIRIETMEDIRLGSFVV